MVEAASEEDAASMEAATEEAASEVEAAVEEAELPQAVMPTARTSAAAATQTFLSFIIYISLSYSK